MKSVTTGFGLCVLGVGIAAYPVLDRLVPRADAGVPRAVGAMAAAATAQAAPTIVWYGINSSTGIYRAWSDGRVETHFSQWYYDTSYNCWRHAVESSPLGNCPRGWLTVSDPAEGYAYRSDITGDGKVDGADIGALLVNWGDAPRHDITPSNCPLNLINP
jgi:hypothetical protein